MDASSACPAARGRHFGDSLLLQDDISPCPAAPGRDFDLLDSISTYPAAQRRHFDLPRCSRTTFRSILLLQALEHMASKFYILDFIATCIPQ